MQSENDHRDNEQRVRDANFTTAFVILTAAWLISTIVTLFWVDQWFVAWIYGSICGVTGWLANWAIVTKVDPDFYVRQQAHRTEDESADPPGILH